MEKEGRHISKDEQQKLLADMQARFEHETDPYFAAARLWVDGIVDPLETRFVVSMGIAMASNNPEMSPFNPGVIQT
jgi:acetyl-CoA carboxylase carboxyltransferase component